MSLNLPWKPGTGSHRGKTPTQLRRELDAALCDLTAMATRIGELTGERNQLEAQLDAARIELSGAREDLAVSQRAVRRLEASLRAWEAHYANQHRVSVPAPRDLQSRVQPLWNRPVTNPGDPGWETA